MSIPGDPANWTVEEAQATEAELDELERTDPDVAAAAASYDRMVERMTGPRLLSSRVTTGAGAWLSERWPYVRIADFEALRASLEALLLAERAEIVARYEAVAEELENQAKAHASDSERAHYPESRARARGASGVALESAARIREAAPK